MINTWFISDTHFGHKNILVYEKESRPFKTIEEMNEHIIDRWNKTVSTNDIVFHLGDFCLGKRHLQISSRLKGKKKLVMGNHDNLPILSYIEYFENLYGSLSWRGCVLTHIPIHESCLGSRWKLNVHGLLHSKRIQNCIDGLYSVKTVESEILCRKPFDTNFDDDPRYFNVSCEQNNLTPIHSDVIMQRLKDLQNG